MADDTPLLLRLPQLQAQADRKYSPTSPQSSFLGSVKPSTLAALQTLDLARVNQGQNPYTADETKIAGTAADTNKAVVAPEPQGLDAFWQGIAGDVRDIAGGVLKIPQALAHEVTELPSAGEKIAQGLTRATNPLEALGNVAQAPGLRMLPGSFIASQFGTGGEGLAGLGRHPVYTLLDVLPYAEEAAGATKTVRLAKTLAAENAEKLGTLPERVRPLTTLATKYHPGGPVPATVPALGIADDVTRTKQALTPNAFGRVTAPVGEALGQTAVGKLAKQVTGRNAQQLARDYNRATFNIHDWVNHPEKAPTELAQAASDVAARFQDKAFAAIPEERRLAISDVLRHDEPLAPLNLNAAETKLASTIRQSVEDLKGAGVQAGALSTVEYPHGTEVFDTATADKIKAARATRDRALAGDLLKGWLRDPQNADAATVHQHMLTMLDDKTLGSTQKDALARGYMTVLDQLGADTFPARRALNDLKGKGFAESGLASQIEVPTSSPIVKESHLAPGAADRLDNIKMGKVGGKKLTFGAGYEATARDVAEYESSKAPARFADLIQREADTRVATRIREASPQADNLEEHLRFAAEHSFKHVPATSGLDGETFKAEADAIYRDVRSSWQDLAAQGLDPVFRHRVEASRAYRENRFPHALDHPVTPSQFRARLWDTSSSVNDLSVAVPHQAMELLIDQASRQVRDSIVGHLARPGMELVRELAPEYRKQAALAKSVNEEGHIVQALRDKGWAPFDPESFLSGVSSKTSVGLADQLFVPAEVAENLRRMKPKPSELGQLLGGPMKVFRTSVLALSPRWHVNNVIGGLIMTMGQARNPAALLQYMGDAYRMTKAGGMGELEVPGVSRATTDLAAPSGKVATEQKYFRDVDLSKPTATALTHHYAAGQTLRRLWDGFQEKVVQRSFDVNQFVDDFYRSMAYLEGSRAIPGTMGKEFNLARGMTAEESVKQGILKSNNVLQQWDTLTPLERSTMRLVFPFYSWAKTVLRYTTQLAVDHPWRVNAIAAIARAEQQDLGTGIPQQFRQLLFLGDPDVDGNVKTVNLAGANPFTDLSNYATLAGFFGGGTGNLGAVTSQLNPFLSTGLQMMGVDPRKGQADLFPELTTDPTTGHLAVAQDVHPGLQLLNNFVPPTRALTNLAGISADFRGLASKDPNAAARLLSSSVGLPSIYRGTLNIPKEIVKDQARQYGEMLDTRNKALKSGDFSLMAQYPGLAAFQRRAEALRANQDAAAPFTPGTTQPGGLAPSLAELAMRGVTQPTG